MTMGTMEKDQGGTEREKWNDDKVRLEPIVEKIFVV